MKMRKNNKVTYNDKNYCYFFFSFSSAVLLTIIDIIIINNRIICCKIFVKRVGRNVYYEAYLIDWI